MNRFQALNQTNTIAYIGDSKTRDLFDAMRSLMKGFYVRDKVKSHVTYEDPSIHLKLVSIFFRFWCTFYECK